MAGSFSFDTPEEVLHILASVRASEATTDQKNDLRDLILSYTNGGKEPSVRIQIQQQLEAFGIRPTTERISVSPEPEFVPDFGATRTVPTFNKGASKVAAAEKPVSSPAAPAPAPAPAPRPEPVVQAPTEPVASKVEPKPPVVPASVASASVAEKAAAVESPAAPAAAAVDAQALQRVREIKSLVNEKVGNPVNLVDIDNAVGREYMSALLDAMKQINAGGMATEAMSRLEASYAAVEKVIENQPKQVAEQAPASVPAAEPSATMPAAVKSPQPEPVQSVQINTSVPPAAPQTIPDNSGARWSNPSPIGTSPSIPKPNPAPVPKVAPPVSAPVTATLPVKSINKTGEPLKSVTDLPTADSLSTAANGDPLFVREVDDGLNQLLSDWVIFKKSGLFGSGPKGIQHPLYLKVKDLQVPVLLAGRFEGATQEVKQSITDYMNGWRYEQGVIYEQGETFEHYLRRVIRHILDLQK